jgi:hypothetical protein
MTDKTSTARIVTGTDYSGSKPIGRSAVQWRNDFLIEWAENTVAAGGMAETVKNAKWEKPRFEIHERETAKREYRAVLMERKANGQLKEVAAVRIGMFGKLLDKPVKAEAKEEAQAAA